MTSAREPIADAHNDLLLEVALGPGPEGETAKRWLEQLEGGGVRLQVCPVSALTGALPELALRQVLEQIAALHRLVDSHSDRVHLLASGTDLVQLHEQRIGLLLSMEGAEPLGFDASLVSAFHALGMRMISLTWNRRNAFADGSGEPSPAGLSRAGRLLVEALGERRIAIDLAHASAPTFHDVLDLAGGGSPLLVSHAACRALRDTPRNLSDAQLRALADRDGLFCLMALPWVIDPEQPTLDRMIDHLEHAVEIAGESHVGLGADFFRDVARSGAVPRPPDLMRPADLPLEASIEGLGGPEDYPALVGRLEARGWREQQRRAILEGNLRRFVSSLLLTA